MLLASNKDSVFPATATPSSYPGYNYGYDPYMHMYGDSPQFLYYDAQGYTAEAMGAVIADYEAEYAELREDYGDYEGEFVDEYHQYEYPQADSPPDSSPLSTENHNSASSGVHRSIGSRERRGSQATHNIDNVSSSKPSTTLNGRPTSTAPINITH